MNKYKNHTEQVDTSSFIQSLDGVPLFEQPQKLIQFAIDEYQPTHIISMFSGGHDSLVADLLHGSKECLCGAYARPGELEEIRAFYPDTAAEIEALEYKVCRKFPWKWEEGPPSWWTEFNQGQQFLPGLMPSILCSSCEAEHEQLS